MRVFVAFLTMLLVANFAIAEIQNSFSSFDPSSNLNVSGRSVGSFNVVSDDSGAAAELAMAGCDLNGPAGSGGGTTSVVTTNAPVNYDAANVVDPVNALRDNVQLTANMSPYLDTNNFRPQGNVEFVSNTDGGTTDGTTGGDTTPSGTNDPGRPAARPAISPEPSTMLVVGLGLVFGALPISRRLRRK